DEALDDGRSLASRHGLDHGITERSIGIGTLLSTPHGHLVAGEPELGPIDEAWLDEAAVDVVDGDRTLVDVASSCVDDPAVRSSAASTRDDSLEDDVAVAEGWPFHTGHSRKNSTRKQSTHEEQLRG